MKQMKRILCAGLLAACALPLRLPAQEGAGDVVYVPTPQVVVEEMLRMAKVGPADFVIDLGSGDGRMVITAVKKFGARGGFGVDLDKVLLKISNEAAQREGVADRVRFFEQNLFETDLSQATVITSYLLPEMNERLRPKLLTLKPGTRVVAHDYAMGEWSPDAQKTLDVPEKTVGNPGKSYVYLWIVPAKVAGRWLPPPRAAGPAAQWEFELTQRFQMVDGVAKGGSQTVRLRTLNLEADQLSIIFFTKPGDVSTRHEFRGTVKGDSIEGTLKVGPAGGQQTLPWSLRLAQGSDPKPSPSAAPPR